MPFVGSRERVKHLPDHFDGHYLFRTEKGVLARGQIQLALKKLAPHLKHEEQPYLVTAHQFRHSIATVWWSTVFVLPVAATFLPSEYQEYIC
jgi:hypothetical protein